MPQLARACRAAFIGGRLARLQSANARLASVIRLSSAMVSCDLVECVNLTGFQVHNDHPVALIELNTEEKTSGVFLFDLSFVL